jgi:hypothetical protein
VALRSTRNLSILDYLRVQETLTHVLPSNLCPTFFQTVLDVFLLVSLVVPQTSNEVVEGLFEPSIKLDGKPGTGNWGMAHILKVLPLVGWQYRLSKGGNRGRSAYKCTGGML